MKNTILYIVTFIFLSIPAAAQTISLNLTGCSNLCGTMYVTFYAVDGSCNSYASVPIAVNPNSNLSPNLFSAGTWAGGTVPPSGFTIDAAYVNYGPSCSQGNPASPTDAGCPHYDYAVAGDPSSCAFSVSASNCFEDSGAGCSVCGEGKIISIVYSREDGWTAVEVCVW